MLVLCGKTASGKTSILNKLVSNYGYKPIITYTTRPMRKNEINGVTYHYISNEEFNQKILDGFFAEWTAYETVDGVWKYGSAKEDYSNSDAKTVVILTPDGYKDICDSLGYCPRCIYVYANRATICSRLAKRGDKKDEAERRIAHDNENFKGFDMIAYKIVHNELSDNLDEVVAKIDSLYRRD